MKLSILLAGASTIALAMGATTARASAAATPPIVYGGGGTLAAKVYRDVFNCYSVPAGGIYATSPGNPANVTSPTAENSACTTTGTGNAAVAYEPVGSGAGLAAYTTANPVNFGSPSTTNTIAYLNGDLGITQTPYPEIQFAGSDAYLNSTQASQAQTAAGEPIFVVPTFVTPIDIVIGEKNLVKLTITDMCNIFSGSTNKSASKVVFSELVVRSDGSGTSFILSDWLSQNCPASLGFNAANGFPSTKPNWTAVAAANGNAITIVPEAGSGGVAAQVASTQNAIGYVSPDYAYPVVSGSTAYPAYVNGYQPTVKNVTGNLNRAKYPTSYNAATIGQQINDQLVAPGASGYPIIGYTFIDAYQCYSASFGGGLIGTPAQGAALLGTLKYFYAKSAAYTNIINGQGFVIANNAVSNLLKGTGGPFNATGGIQNRSCPKT